MRVLAAALPLAAIERGGVGRSAGRMSGRIGMAGPDGSRWVRPGSCCGGSGRAGGGGEWMDRRFADEEAEHLADGVGAQIGPVPGGVAAALGLAGEGFGAAGLLQHQRGDAAAEILDDQEQLGPEGAGAEAWHDGEIEADIDDDAADWAAAHLALELLQCGHDECGKVRAGGLGRGWPRRFGGGGWRAVAGVAHGREGEVAAGGGAREQHALEGEGPQEAAVEVGEDGVEIGGAEACGDGGECGGGGALADGGEEMLAEVEQDGDAVEGGADALGHGVARRILRGIGRRGWWELGSASSIISLSWEYAGE